EKAAVLRELDDARVAVTVGHIKVAVSREGDVGWTVEQQDTFVADATSPRVSGRDGVAWFAETAKHHLGVAFRVQLEHDMGAVIDRPQIARRVEAHGMGAIQQRIAESADDCAGRIEPQYSSPA